NVPTRCVQVLCGRVGPSTGRRAPLVVRTRSFATPASRKSMYWLLTQPFTVFSKTAPFCPADVGRTQASTDTAFARSSTALGPTVIAGPEPEKVAAVSPATAPGWPRLTPASNAPAMPLPLASRATGLPAGYTSRQYAA